MWKDLAEDTEIDTEIHDMQDAYVMGHQCKLILLGKLPSLTPVTVDRTSYLSMIIPKVHYGLQDVKIDMKAGCFSNQYVAVAQNVRGTQTRMYKGKPVKNLDLKIAGKGDLTKDKLYQTTPECFE